MKPAKWRDLSNEEIRQRIRELGEEIFNLRFQLATGISPAPGLSSASGSWPRLARPVGGRRAMGMRKTRVGVVVSDRMQKTRVVRIERVHRHPRYQRVVRTSKKVKAHDEHNASRVGDVVLIEETRPLSREKRWRIREIFSRVS